jgi:diaminohydroxyphosphoribosylaminopyrimidine deaminase / 5-amino-6-(5-phosphoribosylamino)uracil reductase
MEDEFYMKMAMKLAKRGQGRTSPNPMVGAVVVKNGEIVGKGYHKRYGEPHAEGNALKKAGENSKGATLYVNLEPCCIYGHTPPCTETIIKSGINKVVCSTADPNPKVKGKGIKKLKQAKIEVKTGVLKAEAEKLNEAYFKFMKTGLPLVILKVAQTIDGKIATKSGDSKWITSEDARKFVHQLRSQVDAVLIGANTAIKDNPDLTIHNQKGENPKRIILDSYCRISPQLKLIKNNKDGKTIVGTVDSKKKLPVEVWRIKKDKEGKVDLLGLLKKAKEKNITSILVEGGSEVFTSLLKSNLVDKIYCFISPKILGEGKSSFGDLGIIKVSDSICLKDAEIRKFSNDLLISGYLVGRKNLSEAKSSPVKGG